MSSHSKLPPCLFFYSPALLSSRHASPCLSLLHTLAYLSAYSPVFLSSPLLTPRFCLLLFFPFLATAPITWFWLPGWYSDTCRLFIFRRSRCCWFRYTSRCGQDAHHESTGRSCHRTWPILSQLFTLSYYYRERRRRPGLMERLLFELVSNGSLVFDLFYLFWKTEENMGARLILTLIDGWLLPAPVALDEEKEEKGLYIARAIGK